MHVDHALKLEAAVYNIENVRTIANYSIAFVDRPLSVFAYNYANNFRKVKV